MHFSSWVLAKTIFSYTAVVMFKVNLLSRCYFNTYCAARYLISSHISIVGVGVHGHSTLLLPLHLPSNLLSSIYGIHHKHIHAGITWLRFYNTSLFKETSWKPMIIWCSLSLNPVITCSTSLLYQLHRKLICIPDVLISDHFITFLFWEWGIIISWY